MRLQTEGAVDATGKALPVAILDTKATVAVTLHETLASSSPASTTFGATEKTYPSCTLTSASTGTITITSILGGYDGSHISVTVAAADTALAVAVSGKDITITPKANSTLAQVAAAIAAHTLASMLITATVVGTSSHVITAEQPKQYLTGWDRGSLGTLVRAYNAANGVCFIGGFPEGNNGTPTASMPMGAGAEMWFMVDAGEKIVAKAASGVTGVLYLTPSRKY